jgi:hypothetical protein
MQNTDWVKRRRVRLALPLGRFSHAEGVLAPVALSMM